MGGGWAVGGWVGGRRQGSKRQGGNRQRQVGRVEDAEAEAVCLQRLPCRQLAATLRGVPLNVFPAAREADCTACA